MTYCGKIKSIPLVLEATEHDELSEMGTKTATDSWLLGLTCWTRPTLKPYAQADNWNTDKLTFISFFGGEELVDMTLKLDLTFI